MKTVYKKCIEEKVIDAINSASENGLEIEFIEINEDELLEIYNTVKCTMINKIKDFSHFKKMFNNKSLLNVFHGVPIKLK